MLIPCSNFTIADLTAAYNQTRVDYLVPMPMTPARLAEYIRLYDVDLAHSWVAVEGGETLGLAMLGVRPGRTWVTRLGVLPGSRRRGTGQALLAALLESTRSLGCPRAILEVIEGNTPAQQLFRKVGFRETRPLLILRRPPGAPAREPAGEASWLDASAALARLDALATRLPWTNERESYLNAGDMQGVQVDLGAQGQGWLVFRRESAQLSHFGLHTMRGEPAAVAAALLAHLYCRFPELDTYTENLPAADPHLPALLTAGFSEAFRRTEMLLDLPEGQVD